MNYPLILPRWEENYTPSKAEWWQVFIDMENAVNGSMATAFAWDEANSAALVFAYKGGPNGTAIVADGALTLDPSTINYIEINPADGSDPVSNALGWTDGLVPLYQVTTDGAGVTGTVDVRSWFTGGSASSAWSSITGTPTTLAGYGITDAASDAELAAEVATLETADATLQDNIDTVADDLADHEAEPAPHADHFDVDGSKPLTGDADAGGFHITNLADGAAPTDAATKQQLDAVASGYLDLAQAKAMATWNVTLSGPQTIDAVACVADDRVFLALQTTTSENGPWMVKAGAWERPADFGTGGTTEAGTRIFVTFGTVHKGQSWTLLTDGAEIDADALEWTQTGAAGTGEINTSSNAGAGAQVAKAKAGVDLPMRSIVATDATVEVVQNTDTIGVKVLPGGLALDNIGGSLGATKGGTGQTTYTLGDLIWATATNVLGKLAAWAGSGKGFLQQDPSTKAITWGKIAAAELPVFGPCGPSHAPGVLSDPGSTVVHNYVWYTDGTIGPLPTALGAVSGSGNGVAGRVGIWSDANTLTSDAGLFFDTTNNRLGINNAAPAYGIDLIREAALAVISATAYGSGQVAAFTGRVARGTKSSPTAVQAGDILASFAGYGHDGTNFGSATAASMRAVAAENFATGARGGQWLISVIQSGTTTLRDVAVFDQSGAVRLMVGPLEVKEQGSTPATPASGYGAFYPKGDHKPYFLNSSGAESELATAADLAQKAPLASPAFTSVPTAPTASPGTNTTQLATTAFVTAAVTASGGGGSSLGGDLYLAATYI